MHPSKLKNFAQYARRELMKTARNKLALVLAEGSPARREQPKAVAELEKQLHARGENFVTEQAAYTWFNRFCALRFMDANRYNRVGVVSPLEGQFQPEILAEAKMGVMDEKMIPAWVQQTVADLLGDKIPSQDPQNEAYRLILVAVCNYRHRMMPFLFERIADYTELLMPDDLLSGNSILAYVREAMTSGVCKDVEVIGWLYQFYISEKKDEVFAGLKKNKKVTPENIPAATQLFTPEWIVRYLVENSLGRLWMLNRPASRLADRMEYYIKPDQKEVDFLEIDSPEEIKVCDPACGSGHMLVYAFELLYAMYEEEGYDARKIPGLILEKNLFGIEIDERAGAMASFALVMKAREKHRRFFRKMVQPNICVLEKVCFEESEVKSYMEAVQPDLFSAELETLLGQFEAADNIGSLIRPALEDVAYARQFLDDRKVGGDIFLRSTHQKVLKVLEQAGYLASKYHVVIANPPYMGGKGMNPGLKKFAQKHYKISKSDLFAMFMERNLELAVKRGMVAMITMQSWMFISSFEKLRTRLLDKSTILSMAHLGSRGFDSIGGEVVSTTAFVLASDRDSEFKGHYLRLVDGKSEAEKKDSLLEAVINPDCGWFYRASANDFKKIPGRPLAYWVSEKIISIFDESLLEQEIITEGQNKTANNDKYVRLQWEVSRNSIGKGEKWLIYSKGGDYRKWFGNLNHLVNWSEDARLHYRNDNSCRIIAEKFWYKEGITWTDITSGGTGFRYLPSDTTFDMAGPTVFFENSDKIYKYLNLLNSVYTNSLLPILNPTLHAQLRDIKSIPKLQKVTDELDLSTISKNCVTKTKKDWDSYETSWDFTTLPLLNPKHHHPSIKTTFTHLRTHWQKITLEMQKLEQENNKIFINAYGLQDELTPEVPLSEITLTCNPHYRYSKKKTEEEREKQLLTDTIKEYISYAVGCMFGRYAIDKPGLILANQGETIEDYHKQIPKPAFTPDDDNVIPITDIDWFPDDMAERFKTFVKTTFGEENYTENIAFIEQAVGKDIRKYFLKNFYADHIKTYKKRPVYWMFSSPKGSFNALIYLHRYKPDTVSIVLNDYLREYKTKLAARKENLETVSISPSAEKKEKTKALKEIEKTKKVLDELDAYERETLYPLATKQIEIDLDDGVKANYPKFGKALKKVAGLSS